MALNQAVQLFTYALLKLQFLTYYAIASDLIVLPGQGSLMIVTVQVPSSSRSWRREEPLSEEKRCAHCFFYKNMQPSVSIRKN